jgi:hypothetical protein
LIPFGLLDFVLLRRMKLVDKPLRQFNPFPLADTKELIEPAMIDRSLSGAHS